MEHQETSDLLHAEAVSRIRSICAAWPGVSDVLTWGNPTFKASGKSLAVIDRYENGDCIWLRCGAERRAQLLGQEGYFPAPYDRQKCTVCRQLSGIDWDMMQQEVRDSYLQAMPG